MMRQHGLATRPQALAAGLSEDELRRAVASGQLLPVRRGVYVDPAHWASLDEYAERPRLRALAASLRISHDHVLSHESAADWLGLGILRPQPDDVHVTRVGQVTGSRRRHGVCHHGARFGPSQVVEIQGVRVLDAARTAVDIARSHGRRRGLVACDSALRAGASLDDLRAAADPMRSWPGRRAIEECLALADPGAESVAETLGRELVLELGIGRPETQFEISDGHRTARCDLRVGRHLFEVDGRFKYVSREDGGLADDPQQAVWAEKRRQDFLTSFRLGVSRIVWEDFWGEQRNRARRRLLLEYQATTRVFGTDISDLATYLVRRRPL